jgi:hypothetical protein
MAQEVSKPCRQQLQSIPERLRTRGTTRPSNASWYYSIRWHNRHNEGGFPVAVMLQYGHGTGTGGFVQGRNYIMPAIRPIFDQIAAEAWKEVTTV